MIVAGGCSGGESESLRGSTFVEFNTDLLWVSENPRRLAERYDELGEFVEECMGEAGFDLVGAVNVSRDDIDPVALEATVPGYALFRLDRDIASSEGFALHRRAALADRATDLPGTRMLFDNPDFDGDRSLISEDEYAYLAALWGDDRDEGCFNAGIREIGPLAAANAELFVGEQALHDAESRFLADPDVSSAAASWAACMADRGWRRLSPPWSTREVAASAFNVDLSLGSTEDELGFTLADEVRLATDYVDCISPVRSQLEVAWDEAFGP